MIVVDASAAAGIMRAASKGYAWDEGPIMDERTIAPAFFRVETAQVAWKYAHAGYLDGKGAQEMTRNMFGLVDDFYDDESLMAEALAAAVRLDHPVYDMLYLVLARRTASTLLTCDRQLARLCADNGVECIELAPLP